MNSDTYNMFSNNFEGQVAMNGDPYNIFSNNFEGHFTSDAALSPNAEGWPSLDGLSSLDFNYQNYQEWLTNPPEEFIGLDQHCGTAASGIDLARKPQAASDSSGCNTQSKNQESCEPTVNRSEELEKLREEFWQLKMTLLLKFEGFENKLEGFKDRFVKTEKYIDQLLPWTEDVHGAIAELTNRISETDGEEQGEGETPQ